MSATLKLLLTKDAGNFHHFHRWTSARHPPVHPPIHPRERTRIHGLSTRYLPRYILTLPAFERFRHTPSNSGKCHEVFCFTEAKIYRQNNIAIVMYHYSLIPIFWYSHGRLPWRNFTGYNVCVGFVHARLLSACISDGVEVFCLLSLCLLLRSLCKPTTTVFDKSGSNLACGILIAAI